ncbi:MAG: hypothetical protein K2L18_12515 [Acetatifactor sp.]|nr:hypothetical protein [Acetatifactor sp.]
MYYDKQIRYIDYMENGEKQRNCGYIKMTVTDNRLLLEMQIKGLYETDDVASEVMLEGAGAERRIGTILIRQGSGSFQWEFKDTAHTGEELAIGEGLCYGQLERIRVQLSPRRSLRCVWREMITRPQSAEQGPEPVNLEQTNVPQDAAPVLISRKDGEKLDEPAKPDMTVISSAPEPLESAGEPQVYDLTASVPETGDSIMAEADFTGSITENLTGDRVQSVTGNGNGGESEPETGAQNVAWEEIPVQAKNVMEMAELHQDVGPDVNWEPDTAPENNQAQMPPKDRQTQTASKSRQVLRSPRMASMCEDKWQQLQKIYPHTRPFQDEREYLSLRPEDFVILHSSAYQLVQNSFLLHGYFNYDHLILTQVSHRNGSQFYIGVPGNFYEKEKQVAIMYGFGSFECRQEPAQEGDFGYYMIKVEL